MYKLAPIRLHFFRKQRKVEENFEEFRPSGRCENLPSRHDVASVRSYADWIYSLWPDTGAKNHVLLGEPQSNPGQPRAEADSSLLPNLGSQP